MENEIRDLISKHLPEQVGTLLKERLSQADENKEELLRVSQQNNERLEQINKLNKLID